MMSTRREKDRLVTSGESSGLSDMVHVGCEGGQRSGNGAVVEIGYLLSSTLAIWSRLKARLTGLGGEAARV